MIWCIKMKNLSYKAVARSLFTSYDEQPLSRVELGKVVDALKTAGIPPSILQRIDADSARHALKLLDEMT